MTTLELQARPPFDFRATVESHGWSQLAPYRWDRERCLLSRPEVLSGGVAELTLRGTAMGESPARAWIDVRHEGELSPADLDDVRVRATRILGLDQDLSEFHALCRDWPPLRLAVEGGKGRILLSSSLFEDVVKTILTTNVNWGGTVRMTARLVDMLGHPLPWDPTRTTFPGPQEILAGRMALSNGELRLGYRGPYVLELAERVASGALDLSRLEDPSLSTEVVYKELRGLKGIGDYAASSLLMLLRRPERVPVDSWARKLIGDRFFPGQEVGAEQLAGAFDRFGPWRGLAYWFYDWDA